MLAYAPRPDRRPFHPSLLLLIAGGHALALLAVMSARMNLPDRWTPERTDVTLVPLPPEPAPPPPEPRTRARPAEQRLDRPAPAVDPLPDAGPVADPLPLPDPGPMTGSGTDPAARPLPDLPIARTGPHFVTPESAIRPPYPEAKRQLEEEAALRLRLSIDARGRVVAVEPVGRADPIFLEAARRHILRAWRYKPATEGGEAVASSTVVTLTFKLD